MAGGQQHDGGYADPAVDQQSYDPCTPLRIQIQKTEGGAAVGDDKLIDGASVGEHELERQQGDKARDGVSQDGEGTPEGFSPDTLLVQQKRQPQPCKVVQGGGQHGPQQVPAQDLAEGRGEFGEDQQLFEVVQSYPVHQLRRYDLASVIGEGDEDHKDDRQNVKNADPHHRQCQYQHIELLIQQGGKLLLDSDLGQSLLAALLAGIGSPHILDVKVQKGRHHDPGEDAHDEHDDGVIALHAGPGIRLLGSQCEESGDVREASGHKVDDHGDFHQQIDQSLCDGAIPDMAGAHDQHGQLHRSGRSLYKIFPLFPFAFHFLTLLQCGDRFPDLITHIRKSLLHCRFVFVFLLIVASEHVLGQIDKEGLARCPDL